MRLENAEILKNNNKLRMQVGGEFYSNIELHLHHIKTINKQNTSAHTERDEQAYF